MRGGMALSVASFGVGFINYLTNMFIARGLGSGGFGEFATVISYTALLSVPLSTISAEIIKRISHKKQAKIDMWQRIAGWESLVIKRITSYYWTVIFYPIIVYLIHLVTGLTVPSSIFLSLYILLLVFVTFYAAVAQGAHEFAIFTQVSVTGALIKLLGALFVAYAFHSIYIVFVFYLVAQYAYAPLHKRIQECAANGTQQKSKHIRLRSILLRRSVIITMFSLLGFGLMSSADLVTLKHFTSGELLGLLGGWSLLAKIISYVFGPLGALALLYFSNTSSVNKSSRQVHVALVVIILGSVIAFSAYSIFPKLIIELILGHTFVSISPVLAWAACYGFLLTCAMLLSNYFIAKNSLFALVPVGIVPIQMAALATSHQSLFAIIQIDIASSLAVVVGYLIGLLLYNRADYKHAS